MTSSTRFCCIESVKSKEMDYTVTDCQIADGCSNYKNERKEGDKVVLLGSLCSDIGKHFDNKLQMKEFELIKLRAEQWLDDLKPICPKHRFTLGKNYRPPQGCKSHLHPLTSKQSGEKISYDFYLHIIKQYPSWNFILGNKVCRNCIRKIKDEKEIEEQDVSDEDYIPDYPITSDKELTEIHQTLNNLLQMLSLKPPKYTIDTTVDKLETNVLGYFKKFHQKIQINVSRLFSKLIAPGQEDKMFALLCDDNYDDIKYLIEAFKECKTRHARVSVLSLIPHKRLSKQKTEQLFGCSSTEIVDARAITKANGPCAEKSRKQSVYSRLSMSKCEHFVSFLFDTSLLQETAYGTTKVRYSSGEKVCVSSTILNGLKEFAVTQYLQYCEEIRYPSLSRSTLLRLLQKMNPKVRKQLSGVDSYVVEGIESFKVILTIVTFVF